MGRSAVEGDALGEVDAGGAAPEGGDAELGFGAKAIVATLAFFSLMAVIVAPVIFARGFALARLWALFAEPRGLPHLGVDGAIGVNLILSVVRGTGRPKEKSNLGKLVKGAAFDVFAMFVVVAVGYAVVWISR